MNAFQYLQKEIQKSISALFSIDLEVLDVAPTRKEFDGDYTLVVFSLLKYLKGNPQAMAQQIGAHLEENSPIVKKFNVIKGFLNLELTDQVFSADLESQSSNVNYGIQSVDESAAAVMVEYSSPNTNKPLHLGHIRNNLLGYSVAEIIKASGKKVIKTQVINDRGIHICKSMLAWLKFGKGETPESTQTKGDHLVGKYYVAFDKAYKEEIKELIAQGKTEEEAKKEAPLLAEAQAMLLKWEANDPDVLALWETMNQWVYDGFAVTYKRLGVDFDTYQYESQTYLLGKDIVQEGLVKKVFYKKEDGSVWCNLDKHGLDEKLVLRKDGTSVYMTQDIGTAIERFDKHRIKQLVYTVGNEQDYHFKVLFLILQELGYSWSNQLEHLSYGMVDLPEGKMKSREGTVVDADDLMDEMEQTAKEISEELGKIDDLSTDEKEALYESVGMGALKYFILKVDPKKRILFNPKESVDFNGNTGPFIQYTYARIQALFRTYGRSNSFTVKDRSYSLQEKNLLVHLTLFQETISKAAETRSPSIIANYTYDLVKLYNGFYQNNSVLKAENEALIESRLALSQWTSNVIKTSLALLGISTVNRM